MSYEEIQDDEYCARLLGEHVVAFMADHGGCVEALMADHGGCVGAGWAKICLLCVIARFYV